MRNRKGHRGLTLVELCFGLAIVALLVGMAAPGFRGSLRAAAVRSATFELLGGLQQARGHSILLAKPAELCPSDAAGNCQAANTPSSYWRASVPAAASGAAPVSHALPAGVVVRASRSPLRFWPDAQSASTGTLTICDTHGIAPPRAIVLSLSGRARLAEATREKCR
jgi:Tfp pilus assembly protein FimT